MKEIFCVFVSGFSSKVLNHFTQFHFPANWSLSWSTQHISQRQCTVPGSFRSWKRYLDIKDMRTPSTYPLPLLMMPTTVYLFLWEHIKGPPESSYKSKILKNMSLKLTNYLEKFYSRVVLCAVYGFAGCQILLNLPKYNPSYWANFGNFTAEDWELISAAGHDCMFPWLFQQRIDIHRSQWSHWSQWSSDNYD